MRGEVPQESNCGHIKIRVRIENQLGKYKVVERRREYATAGRT